MSTRRRALCIGLTFASDQREPATTAPEPLPFAGRRISDIRSSLELLGYVCTTADDNTLRTAEQLGAAVTNVITDGGNNDVQIVHVLSHGEPAPSGVHVVAADGDWTPATNVSGWVAAIEDYPDKPRPCTLFLVDFCHAGNAARLVWQPAAGSDTRAWVIAATEVGKLAYDGRFSQAVATVLTRLADGDIDFYPREYVPFGDVVEHIRREVTRLGGNAQLVTSTPVDGSPAPPFFPNRRTPSDTRLARAKHDADRAMVPFLDLDIALDPAHFLDRAAGQRLSFQSGTGCFTGRRQELAELAKWLDGATPGALRVVTGGAGSGKSALIGMLVCAAHPQLRPHTERLWGAADQADLPAANPQLIAVHLRERDLRYTFAAIARQLRLSPSPEYDTDALISAIARRADPPVIIVDALDEATHQLAIMQKLLVPLARAKRQDGTPICRLLVGMRPWEQFQPLRDLTGSPDELIDLDLIPLRRLKQEIQEYVNDLLSLIAYPPAIRRVLARRISAELAAPDRERGGEFLAAALYTHWLTARYPDGMTLNEASQLTRTVPHGVPDLLALELDAMAQDPWLRRIITAIAHGHGAGMPATVITRLAPVFAADGDSPAEPTATDFERVLYRIRFYLRSSPDTDGTTLYRLFHQGLVDYLRSTSVDHGRLFDRLLLTVPVDDNGRRRWDASEPYVQRHRIQHAVDAGRLDHLVDHDPIDLEPLFNTATTPKGRLAAAIYRQSVNDNDRADLSGRRDLLAINAARFGTAELAAQLAHIPTIAAASWRPLWSTGGQLATPPLAVIARDANGVRAVACAALDGRPVAVTGGVDRMVRMWDLITGQAHGPPLVGHEGEVRAVACTTVNGRPMAVTGGVDKTLRRWDLTTAQPFGEPLIGHDRAVAGLACTMLNRRAIAVSAAHDKTLRMWDLATGRPYGRPLMGHTGWVTAVACTALDGRPVAVTGSEDRTVRVWDLLTGQPAGEPLVGHESWVMAVACMNVDGQPIVVTGGLDGKIRVWDLATGACRDHLPIGHTDEVRAAACLMLDGHPVAVTGGVDRSVRLWDLRTGQPHGQPLTGHTRAVAAIASTRLDNREVVVTAGYDWTVRAWDLSTGHSLGRPLSGHTGPVTAVACAADGSPLAVTGAIDGSVRRWDLAMGQAAGPPLTGHERAVTAVACTTVDGRPMAVSGGLDGRLQLWDLHAGQALERPPNAHTGGVTSVVCAALDGSPVAVSSGQDGLIRVWDLSSWKEQLGRPMARKTHAVAALACTTMDGRPAVVSASFDGSVWIWDLATGEPLGPPLTGHAGSVVAIACATVSGQPVAITAGSDRTTRLWDLTASRIKSQPLFGDVVAVSAIVCAELDGREVAIIAGADRTVRIRDMVGSRAVQVLALPEQPAALAVTPQGELLIGYGWEVGCFRRNRWVASAEDSGSARREEPPARAVPRARR